MTVIPDGRRYRAAQGFTTPNVIMRTSFRTTDTGTGGPGWTSDKTASGSGTGSQTFAGFQHQSGGTFTPPFVGDGLTAAPSLYDEVNTAADYSQGGGGRGFLHKREVGTNQHGGSIKLSWDSAPLTELWFRWYQRIGGGLTFTNGDVPHYTKDLYFNSAASPFWIVGFSSGTWYTHTSPGSTNNFTSPAQLYASFNNGAWHLCEVHFKQDTNGSNGVLQMWHNETICLNLSNVNFGTDTFDYVLVGHNQDEVSVAGHFDFDDMVLADGYVGPYHATRGW